MIDFFESIENALHWRHLVLGKVAGLLLLSKYL